MPDDVFDYYLISYTPQDLAALEGRSRPGAPR